MHAPRTTLGLVAVLLLSGCSVIPGVKHGPSAKDFASSATYSTLVIEIDYVNGDAPRDAAIQLLKQRVNERLSKPGGVTVEQHPISAGASVYTLADIQRTGDANYQRKSGDATLVLHVLYLNGHSSEDGDKGQVLGLHFGVGNIAIFKETVDGSGGLAGIGVSAVEQSVLVHEFGHAAGLVNNGIAMTKSREDLQHAGHSTNSESVMYWAIDNTLGLKSLTGQIPNDFDADDQADLRAVGGK